METTIPLILTAPDQAKEDTELRLTSVVTAKRDLLCCELGDTAVMLDLGSGVYYGLDPVGTRIWTLIQQPMTLGAVITLVLEEYAVEPARCEEDLRRFLAEMVQRNLVDVSNP
jgi:hypothetical protein